MKRAVTLVLLVVAVMPLLLFAKPKKMAFNNSPQEVFQAALRTARERHVVTYVDEKNLMLTFETGTSGLSYGFNANASVEPLADNKAELIINVQKKNQGKNMSISWGAGDRMADKFFAQVEEELARKPKQKVEEHPEAPHVEVPPAPVAARSESAVGTVMVFSTPDGAEVLVDGNFMGNAPSILKLAPGKHVVSVNQQGYKPWTRELSTSSGSEVKLNANLDKQ